jgi:hypothetical protein
MSKKVTILLLCASVLSQCISDEDSNRTFEVEKTTKMVSIHTIKIDTIFINHPNSSFVGFFEFDSQQKKIYFFDQLFCTVSVFMPNGQHTGTFLGKGQGPKEIKEINSYLKIGDNHVIFHGWKIDVFNNNWERLYKKYLDWQPRSSMAEMQKKPQADEPGIYEVKYFNNHYASIGSQSVVFNIESTHPQFNGYFNNSQKEYYKTAKIWALADIKTGKVKSIEGQYPNIYHTRSDVPNFSNWYFDTFDDGLLVSFEADSLMYAYDKTFKIKTAFGRAANIDTEKYPSSANYDLAMRNLFEERGHYPYYYQLKYFPENFTLFRTYKLGLTTDKVVEVNKSDPDNSNPSRMQIYKKKVLIGDVAIPNGFRIIGFDGQYYYADGLIDDENEKLAIFRFKL